MNATRLKAYIYLLIVVVIWGVAPSVIKFALAEIPPFSFLTYRFFITVAALLPFYIVSKQKGLNIKTLPDILLASFLASTATLGLLFYGENLTTSLDASLISATSPIFAIVIGALLLHEHVTKREKIGIIITTLGTLLIAFQSYFEFGAPAVHSIYGNNLIFLSNLTFALSLFVSKNALRKGTSPFTLMFMMFVVGLVTIIPFAYFESGNFSFIFDALTLSWPVHASVVYMAFFSGAIAYYLYQKAQKTIETSEAAVFLYLQPLVTAPVGVLWLHEKITAPYIVGSVIIALGVFLAEWKKKRYNS